MKRTSLPAILAACLSILSLSGVHGAETTGASVIPHMLKEARTLEAIPFSEVVEASTGRKVLPVIPSKHHRTLEQLTQSINNVIRILNAPDHAIHSAGRINEASRYVEDELLTTLNAIPDWKCAIPITESGNAQRSGYPDLRIETPDGIFYLDPKVVASDSESSALRTFYFEPKTATNKITEDAVHLLLGVMHDGTHDGKLRIVRWKLVDLANLPVRLKAEFQSNNRDIYAPNLTVAESTSSD